MMLKRKGIFITGTDTGVGKTYVAAGIASALEQSGIDVGVMKPAETGCAVRKGRMIPQDALRLSEAAGVRDSLALVNPYRFRKPLAPAVAAGIERKIIDPGKIVSAYRTLARRHDFMIVEGAGGIMVPLQGTYTYLDLAGALGLPVVVVARPSLGTINHTALTLAAIAHRGIPVAGIVINYAQDIKTGLVEKTSPPVIESLCGTRILGIVQYRSRQFGMLIKHLK